MLVVARARALVSFASFLAFGRILTTRCAFMRKDRGWLFLDIATDHQSRDAHVVVYAVERCGARLLLIARSATAAACASIVELELGSYR